jgi:protein-disulfide isomerase
MMSKAPLSRLVMTALAAPLMLGLAACDSGGGNGAGGTIEPIEAPAGQEWSEVVTKTPEGGYLMGNPEAPIKLVEFASLTCPHCADFASSSEEELKNQFIASGRVSFEFRNFVRDAIDLTAAQLTRCGTPETFFPLTHQVFANQPQIFEKVQAAGQPAFEAALGQSDERRGVALGQITGLTEFFAARGISKDQAEQCLADHQTASEIARKAQEQGVEYDIQGTPTFLINGTKIEDNTWEGVKTRLQAAGAR